LKILLLNDYATPTGGAEILNRDLLNELRQRGHDARLLATSAGINGGEHFADYQCLGTVDSSNPLFRAGRLLQVANPSAAFKLQQVLHEFKPDVVHVTLFLTQLSPAILPLLRNIPSMYYAVWHRAICPTGLKLLPTNVDCTDPFGKACLKNGCLKVHEWAPLMVQMNLWMRWRSSFDLIAAGSHALKEQLVANGIEPVEVLWHGVPIRPCRPSLRTPPTVAFAGRLIHEKGVHVLIQSFKKVLASVPDAQLIVAGDGPERDQLVRLAEKLGVAERIRFTGLLDRELLESELQSAWVQVTPSLCRETFGLVAAEAMMRGTTVIASQAGGLCELVTPGETGLLVPRNDVAALAQAMTSVLVDRELAESMGAKARAFALQNLSSETYVDKVVQCFDRLLNEKKRQDSADREFQLG